MNRSRQRPKLGAVRLSQSSSAEVKPEQAPAVTQLLPAEEKDSSRLSSERPRQPDSEPLTAFPGGPPQSFTSAGVLRQIGDVVLLVVVRRAAELRPLSKPCFEQRIYQKRSCPETGRTFSSAPGHWLERSINNLQPMTGPRIAPQPIQENMQSRLKHGSWIRWLHCSSSGLHLAT